MNQQSPMLRLWELGAEQHGSLTRAILSAVAGVLCVATVVGLRYASVLLGLKTKQEADFAPAIKRGIRRLRGKDPSDDDDSDGGADGASGGDRTA